MMIVNMILSITMTVIVGILVINLFVILLSLPQTKEVDDLSQFIKSDTPVLVLGAGVINNEEPSTILGLRLDKAVEIHRAYPDQKIIMSGDHREDNYNEVAVMKSYVVERGVPSHLVYLDHDGYSTYESLYRLKHVIKKDKVVIVTQGYHLSRALMLARGLGLDAIGVPANEAKSTRLEREFREIFARLKDVLITYTSWKPLDEQPVLDNGFDLNKSGDLTNLTRD